MVHVEEGDLRALLAQHHPHGVEQLDVLVVVVHPGDEAEAEGGRAEVDLVAPQLEA
jgi:hypothetical protein